MLKRRYLCSSCSLYGNLRPSGLPLTPTDENFTPREIEQKVVELAFFLRVEIEVCNQYTQKDNVLVAFEKVIKLLYLFFHASKSDQNYDHRDQEIELTLD